ncbi:orotidine-5'-phosphate decarboxylase [Beggiatoa alba]|nr:orotidine-5'-phosphate decarboxylase [Beggiatoa alba]
MSDPKIIVALDYSDELLARDFISKVTPELCKLKIGKELFTAAGPKFVENLVTIGFDVFLDLKFHDIPNTVMKACKVAADLGVWMLNVHSLGGKTMMQAAKEGVSHSSTKLIAVTILTSMGQEDLKQVGIHTEVNAQVVNLAKLANAAGLDGVVCSAKEVGILRQDLGDKFLLVTPGIRPKGKETSDQKRVMTPREAMDTGSSYLVIGRPITQSDSPVKTLEQIISEIS